MSISAPTILVIGSVNLDLLLGVDSHPAPGETVLGSGAVRTPGGKGANQATAAARLGGRVRIAARVGRDHDAGLATDLLAEAGVDPELLVALPHSQTGLAVVTVDSGGENSIVVVPGANAAWTAQDARALGDDIAAADIVLCQGELPSEVTDAVAALCREHRTRLVLNLAPYIDVASETLGTADPLVLNQGEAAQLAVRLGLETSCDIAAGTAASLVERGIPSVVLTLGAAGASFHDADAAGAVSAPRVDVVDTTGAGDAFVGGLGLRLAQGDDLESACRYAVRVGAAAVRSPGAQTSYPWAADALP